MEKRMTKKQLVAATAMLGVLTLMAVFIGAREIMHGSLSAVVVMPCVCGVLCWAGERCDREYQRRKMYGQL